MDVENGEIYSCEYEKIEPGVDDAGFEIEEREDGAGINQDPGQSHFIVEELITDTEKDKEGHDPANGIGKAGGEFIDSEELHRQHLHPDEQGGLFPERLVIDLHVQVVLSDDHLPGNLGKVYLIPVEQCYPAQEREEEERGAKDDGKVEEEVVFVLKDHNNSVYFDVKIVK